MTDVLVGRREDTHREEGCVTIEAEIGVMLPQAKEPPQLPEAWKSQGRILPLCLQRDHGPLDTLILDVCL